MVWIETNEQIELELLERIDRHLVPYTVEGITKETKHSRNTVRKYLEMLETRISTYFKPEDIMIKVNNQKIDYFRNRHFSIQKVYLSMLEENITFSMMEQFLYQEFISLEQFCKENYVSNSSMRRKLKKINEFLKPKELKISLIERAVLGKEHEVRHFYFQLYWTIFRGANWPFPNVDRAQVLKIIETMEMNLSMSFSPSAREKFAYFYAIGVIRREQGYRVKLDSSICKFMEQATFYQPMKEILPLFYLSSPLIEDVSELTAMLITLEVIPGIKFNNRPWNSVLLQHQKQNTSVYKVSQFWLTSFEKYFKLTFPEDAKEDMLQKLIRCHARTFLLRHDFQFVPHYHYTEELRETLPIFTMQLEAFFDKLQGSAYKETFINKEYLFPRYALIALKYLNLVEKEKQIVVAIETDSAILFEELIQDKLNAVFGRLYDLKFVSINEKYDVVITNFPLEDTKAEKTIFIRSELNTRDWMILQQEFDEIIKEKQKKKIKKRSM